MSQSRARDLRKLKRIMENTSQEDLGNLMMNTSPEDFQELLPDLEGIHIALLEDGVNPFKDQPKTLDAFMLNAVKIRMFLSNKELFDTYLRKLNTLIQDRMKEAGLATDELQRDHRKVFRKTLEDELEKAGFASGLGKATGNLDAKDFLYAVSQGVILKDPGAPLKHGEFSHAIQWIIISWHQKETNFLSEPVIDFFKKMGDLTLLLNTRKFSGIWNYIVDTISRDYTSPDYLQKVLIDTNDSDMQLLKKIITARSDKRRFSSVFNENKPRTEYDETRKKDHLLLPKPKK